jgi:hypothetical protein
MHKTKTQAEPTIEAERPTTDEVKKETPRKQGEPVKIARAAAELTSGETAGTPARAQTTGAMQGAVGNTRVGQMMTPSSSGAIQRKGKGDKEKADKGKQEKPLPPITTPLPKEAERKPSGAAEFRTAQVRVVVLPDGRSEEAIIANGKRRDAVTDIRLDWTLPGADTRGDQVKAVVGVTPPVLTIRTTYGPGARSGMKSTYGKGTAPEDIKAGKTTLGFHEGSHGTYAIQYLKEHPMPQFQGKAGMSAADFNQAVNDYDAAMEAYKQALMDYHRKMTDCVGMKDEGCD